MPIFNIVQQVGNGRDKRKIIEGTSMCNLRKCFSKSFVCTQQIIYLKNNIFHMFVSIMTVTPDD